MKKTISTLLATSLIVTQFTPTISVFANTIVTKDSQIEQISSSSKAIVSNFGVSEANLKKYNEQFKISTNEIIHASNTGGTSNQTNIYNVLDDDFNTFWESGKVNTDTYTNEVNFEFDEVKTINRVVYAGKRGTTRGFLQEFEIYVSQTEDDSFNLIATGTAEPTQEVLEFRFEPTKVKRIKIVYKNGVQDWAAASEIAFYKEDPLKEKMQGLFTDNTYSKVSEAFNDLEKINRLEEEVQSHVLYSDFKQDIENAKLLVERGDVVVTQATVSNFGVSETNLNAYNDQFKIHRDQIIHASNTGGTSNQTNINNVLDGDLTTFWESGRVNTNDYTNEVNFEFKTIETINRVVYAAKRGTTRGFLQEFEIYTSPVSKGDNFELVATGTAEPTQEVLEFRFEPTKVKRIKIVYKNGVQDWAAASEIAFYKEDSLKDKVHDLFIDQTLSAVKEAYQDDKFLNELLEEVSFHILREDLEPLVKLAQQIYQEQINFDNRLFTVTQEGNTQSIANNVLKMSSFGTDLRSTGIVANPGTELTVYVEPNGATKLPKLVITQHEGHWSKWKTHIQLKSGTNKITVPNLHDSSWSVDTVPGGAIYLENQYTKEEQGGTPTIRIEGGEIFPSYTLGEDVNQLVEQLKTYKQKLENEPKTTIDIFEFSSPSLMITTTTSEAYKMLVEQNRNIEEITENWEEFMKILFDFTGLDESSAEHDGSKIRGNIRLMQPYGAMYAASYHVGVQRNIQSHLFEPEVMLRDGSWGIVHEFGHQFDIPARTWGEITNNMWSNYMATRNRGLAGDRVAYSSIYKNQAPDKRTGKGFETYGYFEKLGFFWQLQLTNENFWPNLEKLYRERNPKPANYQEKKDILALYAAEVLQLDLTEYLERYEFEVSEHVLQQLATYEKPSKLWYLDSSILSYEGNGFTEEFSPQIETIQIKDKDTILTFSVPNHQEDHVLGYEIIRDGEVIGFTKDTSYTDNQVNSSDNHTYEIVAYDKTLTPSQAGSVSTLTPNLKVDSKVVLGLYESFDVLDYVTATDSLGNDLTNEIKIISSNVNTDQKGMYEVVVSVENKGNVVEKSLPVYVMSEAEYVSDMNWKSSHAGYGTIKRDQSHDSLDMVLSNGMSMTQSYEKGIGMHATSEVVLDIEGKGFDTFEAYVGADAVNGDASHTSVKFLVYVDNVLAFESGMMKTDTPKEQISISVDGAKEVKLVMNDGGNGQTRDVGIWANARFMRQSSKPVIQAESQTYVALNQEFDPLENITATDVEDGNLTNQIEIQSNLNLSKPGVYPVTYLVKDKDGNQTSFTRRIVVYHESSYLSDLEWVSATSGWKDVNKDSAVNTKNKIKLKVNGVIEEFNKGIGAATHAEVVYDLNGEYSHFTTYLGTDKNYEHNSTSIIFKIFADGKEVYQSDLIRKNSSAEFVELNVENVQQLTLVAEDAGDSGLGDFASWADPKLYKTELVINHEALSDLIAKVEDFDLTKYTPNSVNLLTETIHQAKELLNESVSQEAIDEMVQTLQRAIDQLQLVADMQALSSLIASVSEMNLDIYTQESVNQLNIVLEEARMIIADLNTPQVQIDEIYEKLQQVISQLEEALDETQIVEIKDKTLKKSILKALSLDNDYITVGDLQNLKTLVVSGGVESLEGLQYAKNLETLNISGAAVSDLSFLKNLKKLTDLDASWQMIAAGMLKPSENKLSVNYEIKDRQGNVLLPSILVIRHNKTYEEVKVDLKSLMNDEGVITLDTTSLESGVYSLFLGYESVADNYQAQVLYMFSIN